MSLFCVNAGEYISLYLSLKEECWTTMHSRVVLMVGKHELGQVLFRRGMLLESLAV